jgi:hypothetical protein
MLRKMFSLGALVVVAVTFGVGNAWAKHWSPPTASHSNGGASSVGFSDGR